MEVVIHDSWIRHPLSATVEKIWCLHCDLRVPLQKTYPLIRWSFAGVASYIFFSIFNYLSYKSLTVFNDFFSLCILLLVNHYKDFFFQFANFLCPMFMCTCISLFSLNVLYMAVEITGVRIHSKCVETMYMYKCINFDGTVFLSKCLM